MDLMGFCREAVFQRELRESCRSSQKKKTVREGVVDELRSVPSLFEQIHSLIKVFSLSLTCSRSWNKGQPFKQLCHLAKGHRLLHELTGSAHSVSRLLKLDFTRISVWHKLSSLKTFYSLHFWLGRYNLSKCYLIVSYWPITPVWLRKCFAAAQMMIRRGSLF